MHIHTNALATVSQSLRLLVFTVHTLDVRCKLKNLQLVSRCTEFCKGADMF